MKHLLMALLFVGYVLGFNTVSWSQQGEQNGTLDVIGRGAIFNDDVAKARDEAVADGLRNAVENGVGISIPSESVVDHFQLLSDHIYARAEEFVHDYKVLTESKSGGYYRVVVRARLFMGALQEKLQAIGILAPQKEMPSLLFLLSEQNIGEPSPRYWWGETPFRASRSVVEDTLSKYMRKKGFVILDPEKLFQDIEIMPEWLGPDLSTEAAVRLGEQLDSDVVVVGNAVARRSGNVFARNMKSIQATVSGRAINTDNGVVIGSSQGTGAALHSNESVGGKEALMLAASAVAEDLTRQITANWQKAAAQSALVDLVVRGIKDYADFVTFRTILRNDIPGVNNVYLRTIKSGEAKMDVDIKGHVQTLADQLMLKNFEGFGVNVFEISQNGIKLELIPKQDTWEMIQ
ncbi:MAG: flagellar assembly protein T N-terminal domain-containing protein [Desulfobacterales bacterium]|nr:flagellar assembly protein T N-terminal domain-containing protein [Desulfobacterales bacterium]